MAWILVVLLVCAWLWSDNRSRQEYTKQFKLGQFYLTLLLLACENKTELLRLFNKIYEHDFNNLPVSDFNDKWTALCETTEVPVLKKPVGKSGMKTVSFEVVGLIADNIFDNAVNKRYIQDVRETTSPSLVV